MSLDHKRPDVSVVIGTYERKPFLRATLESVRDELTDIRHEIIVVDGGSTDGTTEWLIGQRDVVTIVQHNRGEWRGRPIPRRSWGYFMNLGFRAAQAPVVCMLSDDCLVVPGAIRRGMDAFAAHSGAGERVGGVAFYWRNWPSDGAYKVGLTFGGRMFVNHGLYAREALEAVGYADEENFTFYHADGDLILRMNEAGYTCVDAPTSFVEHYLDANHAVRSSNMERQQADWRTYCSRWEHLGPPERDWDELPFTDPADTAKQYWGIRTNRVYRLGTLVASLARKRGTALRARIAERR